jgi:hypothetical protein
MLRVESLEGRDVPAFVSVGQAAIDGFAGPVKCIVVDNLIPGTGPDTVVAPAPGSGGGPVVQVYSGGGPDLVPAVLPDGTPTNVPRGQGQLLASFLAFEESFRGGVSVDDVPGVGTTPPELVLTAGPGGGPVVVLTDGYGEVLNRFLAAAPGFRGGLEVQAGQVASDGPAEIVLSAGQGGAPWAWVYTPRGELVSQFLVGPIDFRNAPGAAYTLAPTEFGATPPGGDLSTSAVGVDNPDGSTTLWSLWPTPGEELSTYRG